MTLKKRLITILVIALCVGGVYGVGKLGITIRQSEETEVEDDSLFGHRETIYIWYTDDALTDYLNSVAVSYSEYQSDVRVIPVYTSGREYLETINQASLNTNETPDLYIVSNDSLEKAYLAGLASEVRLPEGVLPVESMYPQTAVNAVTYHDRQIGYPFYFETSCFLYNETYLMDWARAQIEAEIDIAMAEEALQQLENDGEPNENDTNADAEYEQESAISEETVIERVEQTLPDTIDDILSFAYEYDAPEQVEAVFKWDVSDIFYNYFFVGASIDVGGVNGDLSNSIHIYNEDAIRCLRVYQDLNQFFSIDTKEISYDAVLQDFMDGKIVYTVATTDALSKIEAAKAEGNFAYEYGISMMPDVSEELSSASLSVTQCVVINGYSMKKDMANDFAVYLTQYATDTLYSRTGKLPVHDSGDTYTDPNKNAFLQEYMCSVPMPKMIETSNFWVELEIAFAKIWDGEDANHDLKALSEKIMGQVTGAEYLEEYIEMPEEVPEEEEYVDEELTDEDSDGGEETSE
ncbi:MAG: sugar ABC transporter substrate-binding protein [Lachnospiraceae bacterium]|nr:sugar ABC transporter substrate-binding protein [Lachnospiraceae bacterium]